MTYYFVMVIPEKSPDITGQKVAPGPLHRILSDAADLAVAPGDGDARFCDERPQNGP